MRCEMKLAMTLMILIISTINLFSQNLSWEPVDLEIGKNITHIIPISGSKILFKSENGTFIVTDLTEIKRIDDLLPDSVEITCLAVNTTGDIYAGTNNSGVLTFTETDKSWRNISYNLEYLKIDAIAVSNDNEICIVSSIPKNDKTYTAILKQNEVIWNSFTSNNLSNIKFINYNDLGELFAFNGSILTKVPNPYYNYAWERVDRHFELNSEQINDLKLFKNEYYITTKYNRIKYYSKATNAWISLYEGIEINNNFSSLLITEKAELILFSDSNGVFYSKNVESPFEKNNSGLSSYKVTSSSILKDGKILICTDSSDLFISAPPKGLPALPIRWTDKGKYLERKTSTEGINFIKFSNNGEKIFTISGSHLKIWETETGILLEQKVFLNDNIISASVSKDDKSILLMYLTRSPQGSGNYIVSTEIFDADDFTFIKKYEYIEKIYCQNGGDYNIIKSDAQYLYYKDILYINFTFIMRCDGTAQIGNTLGKLTRVEFKNDSAFVKILYDKPIFEFLFTDDKNLVILENSYSYMYYFQSETSESINKVLIGDEDFNNVQTIFSSINKNKENTNYNPVTHIDYLEKAKKIAGRAYNKIYLWNLENYSLSDSAIFPVKYPQEPITYMFNYNFKKIIAALNTGIYIYSFPDMKVLDSTIFKYETGYNWRIAISPDSSSFAVGTYDGMLRLFKSDLLSDVNDDNNNEFIGQSNLSYLYPNPASDNINFENQSLFSGNIEVYSITGTKLTEQNCISGRTTEIDISGFSRGLYYIKFQNRFYKFVKI